MNIVIVGDFRFPRGGASASRARHMAIGLAALGHRVYVMSMCPVLQTAPGEGDEDTWHDYEGVAYCCVGEWMPSEARRTPFQKVKTLLQLSHRSQLRGVRRLTELFGSVDIDAFIGLNAYYFRLKPIIKLCKDNGVVVIRDVVEWWQPYSFPGGPLSPLYWNTWLNVHVSLPRSDGIIAISKRIADRYQRLGMKVIRIPAIIDPEPWSLEANENVAATSQPFQLMYLGDMNWRDEPLLMVRAIRHVLKQGHEVFLHIVGSDGRKGRQARVARQLVESHPLLREYVKFYGRVSDEEVRTRLFNSDALIFTRVSGKQAESAFPTRLPEFLMTGKPVISTAIGDIPEYLQDGEEIILVAPGRAEALAAGIIRLLQLPDAGRSIGEGGKRQCVQCFDYRSRCQEISDFLTEIVSSR